MVCIGIEMHKLSRRITALVEGEIVLAIPLARPTYDSFRSICLASDRNVQLGHIQKRPTGFSTTTGSFLTTPSTESALLSGRFQFLISFFEHSFVSAVEFIHRSNIADSTVKTDGILILDVLCHNPSGIIKGKGRLDPDAFSFERFMEPL